LRDAAAWFSLAVALLSLTQATISGIAGLHLATSLFGGTDVSTALPVLTMSAF
jgi:hypothetical protein